MTTKTKKTTERAVGAGGHQEAKSREEVEAGYFRLVNVVLGQQDQDIWTIKVDQKNGIASLHEDRDRYGGQQDACNKQACSDADDIEPEPLCSKICDYISPTLRYWASQFAHDINTCSDFEFSVGRRFNRPKFCSLSTGPSSQIHLSRIQNQEVLENHTHTFMMKSSFASSSAPCHGIETDASDGENFHNFSHETNPEQCADFNMTDFDWNSDPDPSSHSANAPMPSERTEFTFSELNGQETPSRGYHQQRQYSEQNSYPFNGCLGCSLCSCGRSASAHKHENGLYGST
ncbi:hypothetical protein ACHAXS_000766 [Conticribra weissflogii]